MQRMFEHPTISKEIIHPYDLENHGNAPGNPWGQRVTSLVTLGPELFVIHDAFDRPVPVIDGSQPLVELFG